MIIFLTIDVECYHGDYDLEVWGRGQGLPYILDTFAAAGVKGTFFVETLGATQWGNEPLLHVCESIRDAGHQLQLHLHPIVARLPGFAAVSDRMYAYDAATQERLLREGSRIFTECVGTHGAAFRAGDLAADAITLTAMKRCGIGIGSNRDLDGKGSIASRVNHVFPVVNDIARFDGITDVPVSVMRSPIPFSDGRFRHLQITALSAREMCAALSAMSDLGYGCATVLMHPGEFFTMRRGQCIPNGKNRKRLQLLIEWLAARKANVGVIDANTVAAIAVSDGVRSVPRGSMIAACTRVLRQTLWRLAHPRRRKRWAALL